MNNKFSRRNFLEILSMGLFGQLIPRVITQPISNENQKEQPNILIILFDAWSASNTSLYDYARRTMPNLERLADKAFVFHNNFAGGPFTTPGTATLISGRYPWSHRAIKGAGRIDPLTVDQTMFHLLKDDYFQISYTHNSFADHLLRQQRNAIEMYLARPEFYLDKDLIFDELFSNDFEAANVARQMSLFEEIGIFQPSLFLQRLYQLLRENNVGNEITELFPRGFPQLGTSPQRFILEDIIDWLGESITQWPEPFLGYFHFLPPHDPYRTRKDYVDHFKDDGFEPIVKPDHPLANGFSVKKTINQRILYDEFLLYVDSEFNRLYHSLEQKGALDNLWIFLTSDHGELFERGELYHTTKLLNQPIVKVPLLVFPPNLTKRVDVKTSTSAVDLLPTILRLTGKQIPDWCEGEILPIFGEKQIKNNPVYAVQAEDNPVYSPFEIATITMILDQYKIIKAFGYKRLGTKPLIEVYNLMDDPEEMNNLINTHPKLSNDLLGILDKKINDVNRPFRK